MPTKLRIKYGPVELDYEGELAFEKSDVLGLLEKLSALSPPIEMNVGQPPPVNGGGNGAGNNRFASIESVADIAQRLDAKSGPDLALAASAALHFISNKTQFESKDISATMRGAPHFFKESFASNLSHTLSRLVRGGKLRDIGSGRYALSNDTIEDMKKRLA